MSEFESGRFVKVVEEFEGHGGDIVKEPVGEVGKIDTEVEEGTYLVLFPGARGWFVPSNALEEYDGSISLR